MSAVRRLADSVAEQLRGRLLEALGVCERELAMRNVGSPRALRWRIDALRRVLTEGRIARVAAVGRRGAGKSSLGNALAERGALKVGDVRDQTKGPEAITLTIDGLRMEWIDTPGLRAAGEQSRVAAVARAVAARMPDVILALCQASEVDAGIDDDLKDLGRLLKLVHGLCPSRSVLLGVVTKVDELAPPEVLDAPFDDPEKRQNIQHAVTVLHRHMLSRELGPRAVVPVAMYLEREGERVTIDGRWNLGALVSQIRAATQKRVIHDGKSLREELTAMRYGLDRELVEAFAARAFALASGPRSEGQRREILALETCLASLLTALWGNGFGATISVASAPAQGVARLLDVARAGAAGVGAWRAGGALAAGRMRVLGATVLDAARDDLSEDIARAMLAR